MPNIEIEFPVVAHHRLIVNAEPKNEAETASLDAVIVRVPRLKMCL